LCDRFTVASSHRHWLLVSYQNHAPAGHWH
jgi:hypothetical protein